MATWFMDAAALGGWTARGTSKVLQDRLQALPADQCPAWMKGLPPHKVEEILTKAVAEAVEASQIIQNHMDVERAKGRDFDEVYDEVKPYLDEASRPMTLEMRDSVLGRDGTSEAKTVAREQASEPLLNLTNGVRAGAQAASAIMQADSFRDFDLREPMLLIGSCNGWDIEEAKQLHQFQQVPDTPTGCPESFVRVMVPEGGLHFQIISGNRQWQWRLFPSGQATLEASENAAIEAKLTTSPRAEESQGRTFLVDGSQGGEFSIEAQHGATLVDVRVMLSSVIGARVWFTKASA